MVTRGSVGQRVGAPLKGSNGDRVSRASYGRRGDGVTHVMPGDHPAQQRLETTGPADEDEPLMLHWVARFPATWVDMPSGTFSAAAS